MEQEKEHHGHHQELQSLSRLVNIPKLRIPVRGNVELYDCIKALRQVDELLHVLDLVLGVSEEEVHGSSANCNGKGHENEVALRQADYLDVGPRHRVVPENKPLVCPDQSLPSPSNLYTTKLNKIDKRCDN